MGWGSDGMFFFVTASRVAVGPA